LPDSFEMKTNESYELDISKPGQETGVVVRYMYRLNMKVDRYPKFIWAPCHVLCTALLIG
jgi:hypothetical protein